MTDFSPLRLGLKWRDDFAKETKRSVRVVDAHNIVPCWVASPKLEVGAQLCAGKLAKLYGDFMVPFPDNFPNVENKDAALHAKIKSVKTDWDDVLGQALERGKDVPEVTWAVPGEKAAMAVLDNFLTKRMSLYGLRNDPAKPQALSGLSPYLHFGQISGQRCAMKALEAKKGSNGKAVDVFFEELVVRRELADNFCYYSPSTTRLRVKNMTGRKILYECTREIKGNIRTRTKNLSKPKRTTIYGMLRNASSRWQNAWIYAHVLGKENTGMVRYSRKRFEIRHRFERSLVARRKRSERLRWMHVVHRRRARPRVERARRVRKNSVHDIQRLREEI